MGWLSVVCATMLKWWNQHVTGVGSVIKRATPLSNNYKVREILNKKTKQTNPSRHKHRVSPNSSRQYTLSVYTGGISRCFITSPRPKWEINTTTGHWLIHHGEGGNRLMSNLKLILRLAIASCLYFCLSFLIGEVLTDSQSRRWILLEIGSHKLWWQAPGIVRNSWQDGIMFGMFQDCTEDRELPQR